MHRPAARQETPAQMAYEQAVDILLQEYTRIEGMERSIGSTPRKAAASMLDQIETFLSDTDQRFTHTLAMAARFHDSVDAELLAKELQAGEPSFDELKAAALEAMAKDLAIHAPAVGKRIREEIGGWLDMPRNGDMADAVRKYAKGVNGDITTREFEAEKRRRIAEALLGAYHQAQDEYESCKASAEKESKRREKVVELHRKVDTLTAVETFLALKRD